MVGALGRSSLIVPRLVEVVASIVYGGVTAPHQTMGEGCAMGREKKLARVIRRFAQVI